MRGDVSLLMGSDDLHCYRVSDGETVSQGLLRALDSVHDDDLADVNPPLTTVIDLDALDRLFSTTLGSGHGGDARVVFTFQGHTVTIHNYGVIRIARSERDAEVDEQIDQ